VIKWIFVLLMLSCSPKPESTPVDNQRVAADIRNPIDVNMDTGHFESVESFGFSMDQVSTVMAFDGDVSRSRSVSITWVDTGAESVPALVEVEDTSGDVGHRLWASDGAVLRLVPGAEVNGSVDDVQMRPGSYKSTRLNTRGSFVLDCTISNIRLQQASQAAK